MRLADGAADGAVVGINPQRRHDLHGGSTLGGLGGREPLFRGEVVGALRIRAGERLLDRHAVERRVRNLVGQRDRLSGRQSNRARQPQLRLVEGVLSEDAPLALVLHLRVGPQDVDAGDEARGFQVRRLLQ